MSRLAERFAALRQRGEAALICFVTAGDPDLATTGEIVCALAQAGADVVEIGVPFSDPMAEGPTIQRSSERSLARGTTLRGVLKLVRELRPRVEVPLVLMGYANNFLAPGEANFAAQTAEVGIDGVICVDMPPEEGETFRAALAERGVDSILLAAPTTTPERMAMLLRETRGFLYYVSLTGVTGARSELARDLGTRVAKLREGAKVPVCVGFGVSTPEQAAQLAQSADGVVVGSALVERIGAAASPSEAIDAAARFAGELSAALHRG